MNHHQSEKLRVQNQFGKNAHKYVSSEGHAHGSDLALAIDWLQPTRSDIALDIATGGGHVAKAIAPFVQRVVVTDLTPTMLANARDHLVETGILNAEFVLADAEELPFLRDSFDVVTCRIAAHHFPNPDAFVREVARVLRPNGRFLFIDNVAPDDKRLSEFINLVESVRDPSHVECLCVDTWKDLFRENGLNVTQDIVREKRYPFQAWIERMAPTNAHRSAVEAMLLRAPQDVRSHFDVVIENENIESFATREWIALAVKA